MHAEMPEIMVINDNNNFIPSLFQSCEIVGNCFGASSFLFGSYAPSKNILAQNNHFQFHTVTSKKTIHIYFYLNIGNNGGGYLDFQSELQITLSVDRLSYEEIDCSHDFQKKKERNKQDVACSCIHRQNDIEMVIDTPTAEAKLGTKITWYFA